MDILVLLVTPQQSSFLFISRMATDNFEVFSPPPHALFLYSVLKHATSNFVHHPFNLVGNACSCFTKIIFPARFFRSFNMAYDVSTMFEPSFIFRFKIILKQVRSRFRVQVVVILLFSGNIDVV